MKPASRSNLMMNAGPIMGMTGGVAALAVMSQPEMKLFSCALLFALGLGSALRHWLFCVAPVQSERADYPFSSHTANPWERDNGPAGL